MDTAVATILEFARIRDDTRVLLATEDGRLRFFRRQGSLPHELLSLAR